VPNGNYVQFIQAYSRASGISLHGSEGEIVTETGEVIGRHNGVHEFTIGQRKGLGFAVGKPLYVISIDQKQNRVVVGDDDALRTTAFEIEDVNWVSCDTPEAPLYAFAKIRHKHEPAAATIEPREMNRARITFDSPQRAITPGQAAVFYDGDRVLGGAGSAKGSVSMPNWNQKKVQNLTGTEIWLFILGRVLVAFAIGILITQYSRK